MARFRAIIDTPWSAESAFDFLADATNFERWDPGTISSRHSAGPRVGLGAEYDVEVEAVRRSIVMSYRTTRYEPPVAQHGVVELEARTASLHGVDRILVVRRPDGAQVTYDAELQFHGAWRVFAPLLSLSFARIGGRAADGLAESLDGKRVAE